MDQRGGRLGGADRLARRDRRGTPAGRGTTPSPPSPSSQAAPQPNPAIPNRSSFSVNGHSSSSRNGSAARAMKCSHIERDDTRAHGLGRSGTSRSSAGGRSPAARWRSASGSAGTAGRCGRRRMRRAPRSPRRDRRAAAPALARRSRRAVATRRASGLVVEGADRGERRDALGPQRLVLPDVADPGQRALVEQRLADRHPGARRIAQPAQRLVGVEVGREQVRPEPPERRVEASARTSRSSTTGASKQTATAPGTSMTSRARPGGRRQRSPGR